MSILITGAGGQLGREWVDYLGNLKKEFSSYTSGQLDISDPVAVNRIFSREKPQTVINCAAWTDVDGAEDHRPAAMAVNGAGAGYLADWCAENRATLIHYSTDYVFPGRSSDRNRYPAGYPEEAVPGPVNWYGQSKLAGERAVLKSGADYILIRTSWLCGQYGKNFVSAMLRLGKTRRKVEVVNDQWGSPAYAEPVVNLTHQLLKRNKLGIFHITSAGMISWFDFAVEIFRQAELGVEVIPAGSGRFPARAGRPSFSKLDTAKICRTLDTGMPDWRSGLEVLLKSFNPPAE